MTKVNVPAPEEMEFEADPVNGHCVPLQPEPVILDDKHDIPPALGECYPVEEGLNAATITVPLGDLPDSGYGAKGNRCHVNVQLSADESAALRRLARGLDEMGARVPGTNNANRRNRRVQSNNDAVRWLLGTLEATFAGGNGR